MKCISTVTPGSDRSEEQREAEDLPRWLAYLTVLAVSLSVPVSLSLNSSYLRSSTGYSDGGDMYSHIVEALHVKTVLQRGVTDFWFANCTLGYPMFLAYHPLPCLLVGSLMAATERFISPLLLFRWLFVLVLSAMPSTWYAGVRQLGMSQLEASLISLTLFSVQSWRKFGLEVVAFQQYGIFTQAYGMLLFPVTVGQIYQYVIRNEGSANIAHILFVLTFLSHAFFGMFVVIVIGTMLLFHWLLKFNISHFQLKIYTMPFLRAFDLHFRTLLFISWWLIPFLANYQYIGGLPWKQDSENGYQFHFLMRQLVIGEVFDHGRKFPLITLLVACGIACICVRNMQNRKDQSQHCHMWIVGTFVITFLLLLGRTTFGFLYDLIPFHSELEVIRYLNGIHFFGLLIAAIAGAQFLIYFCSLVSQTKLKKYFKMKYIITVMFLTLTPFHITNQANTITLHVTATKVCDSFKIFLMRIAESPLTGRVYGQKLLGTGGAWDLAFVPYIAARPGVLTYSRGYHDTLSLFYLESIDMNNNTTGFPDLMRLYNIHFLISSRIKFDRQFLKANKLQVHSSCGTTVILARTRTKNIHGYFEFVYTPGIIYGNLKRIRRVVLKTLKLYSINVLFAVNPILKRTGHPIANVYVKSNCSSFFTTTERNFRKCYSEVTEWRINNQMVNEETFLDVVSNSYRSKPSRSHIVQESVSLNEYSAVVEIGGGQTREDIFAAEHLLLKVTYHPYWSCRYKHVTWDRRLAADSEGTDTTSEEWSDTAVYLVTPNLMSIVLPAGRYHVVFRYRNPLYQKIGFLMFILGLAVLILLCCLDCLKKLKHRVMKYFRSLYR